MQLLRKYDPRVYLKQLSDHRRIKSSLRSVRNGLDKASLSTPFFCVVLPGSLHLTRLFLNYIPENQDIVLVLNGLEEWELGWMKRHLPAIPFIRFQDRIPHSAVIDYLLGWMDTPFGIVDYDCYVFDPEYFTRLTRLAPGSAFSAYYAFENEPAGIAFPETFCMFINTPVLQNIVGQYGITAETYHWRDLSESAKAEMETVGISAQNYPETHKDYFDTFRALMVLSLAKGFRFEFPDGEDGPDETHIYHIGAVSLAGITHHFDVYNTRGSYFWYRALEESKDSELKKAYYARFGRRTAEEILNQLPNARAKIGERFFSTVSRILESENHAKDKRFN